MPLTPTLSPKGEREGLLSDAITQGGVRSLRAATAHLPWADMSLPGWGCSLSRLMPAG